MSSLIHPTAIIDPNASIGAGTRIGPYSVIGSDCEVGVDCEIGPHCQVEGPCRLGKENRIYGHVCLGLTPQDLKFHGERTSLEIGDRNQFHEFSTYHRGTEGGGGKTTIGSDNLFMTGAHVAHDCRIGSHTVLANSATLAGHVTVEDWTVMGAFSGAQQFGRIGQHAYLGAHTIITRDVLPFSINVGQRARCVGVNRIGLERRDFDRDAIRSIERAFRVLLRSGLNTSQALEVLRREHAESSEVRQLIVFVENSKLGITKSQRKGGRGAGD